MDRKVRQLFRAAMERYEAELGLPGGLPEYELEDLDNPPASAFIESKKSGTPVRLTGRTEDGKMATAILVVKDLRNVRSPDQDETDTKGVVCYFPHPDLVGIGEVMGRSAKTGEPVVINRVMFHIARLGRPDDITYGTLLFLDHQP